MVTFRMSFAVFALLLFSLSYLPNISKADEQSLVAELDQLASEKNLNPLIARINAPRDSEEAKVFGRWLNKKATSYSGGARIFYLYSATLYRTGITDLSTFVYLQAMLTARLDAARCADPSAPPDHIMRWEQAMLPLQQHLRSLSLDDRKKLLKIALKIESRYVTRQPDEWLCSGGMSYFLKYNEKHKNDPNPPQHEISDPTNIGRTIVLDDDSIKPEFVPDSAWQVERAKVIEKFTDSFLGAQP